MTHKASILEGISKALDVTQYGKIKLELKTPKDILGNISNSSSLDLVVEKRTRFPVGTLKQVILDAVGVALDTTSYGRITLELRGNKSSIDLVVESISTYTPSIPQKDYIEG